MGIFSLMCLLKRLARSTLSVGKLMKPTPIRIDSPNNPCAQFGLSLQKLPPQKSITKRHPHTHTPVTLHTWHEDQIIIRAGNSLIDLREKRLQIVTISSLHKVSSFRRHSVLHPEQSEVLVKSSYQQWLFLCLSEQSCFRIMCHNRSWGDLHDYDMQSTILR